MRHPFTPQSVLSADAIIGIHATALRILSELGVRILLPEARDLFRKNSALVDDDEMVRIGADLVEGASNSAVLYLPACLIRRARTGVRTGRNAVHSRRRMPNATDLERGRRPGSLRDYEETLKLQQSFDVIHMFGPSAEPQDVPVWFHHYAMMRAQPVHDDKPMFAYARGRRQVAESFEPVRLGLELSEEEFSKGSWVTTITNSRRQIDIPMAEGVIDFARAGRVITPFCLAGARRLWRVRLQCRYEVRFARIRNPRACQNDDRVRTTRPPYRPALATGGRRCVEHGRHAGGLRNAYGSVGGNVGQRHAYRICGGLGRKAD